MNRILAVALILCAANLSGAQSASIAARYFRLTVVLAGPPVQPASKSFVFDIPVSAESTGQAEMNAVSGPTDQAGNTVKESLRCTGVHVSPTGLAAKVSYTLDNVSAEPLPGSTEHLISHFVFEKQVDLQLAVTTEITDARSLKPLPGLAVAQKPAPIRITVTATAL